jgi:hypothetical protein
MKIGLVYVMFEAGLKYFSSHHVGQDLNYPYLLGISAYIALLLVYTLHGMLNAPFFFIIILQATSWPTSNTSTRWASPWSSTCPTSSRW